MKPEISTAVMIERLRALVPESQDGALLNQVANRIELLLAAESGMSREMACIRHALDIPPDQSVQSGVVNECVQLNAKIQDLIAQLAELRGKDPVAQQPQETDADGRNKPGVIVAVHVNAGDFVRVKDQVFEIAETDFDDHDVTLWFIGGEILKCAAGAPIEVVEHKDGDA